MRYVRIKAEPTVDNPDTPPITLDLLLDHEDKVDGARSIFGFQGKLKNQDTMPFVLSGDTLDYGEAYKACRYARLDLDEIVIDKGAILTIFSADYREEKLRITEVRELLRSA